MNLKHRKNNNIRDMCNGVIDFTKYDQSQNNIVNDERDDLLADPHSILNR